MRRTQILYFSIGACIVTGILTAIFTSSVFAAFGDCPKGYFFDRMSGVGCKQTYCNDIPGAHWSYEGRCVCGSSGSETENPLDANKECFLPSDDSSCPGCLAKCVHFNEKCPSEFGIASDEPASPPTGTESATFYDYMKDAFSQFLSIGSDLMEAATGAKINQRDDPNSFFSGLVILSGGDSFDIKFSSVNAAADKKNGLALEWNFVEIKTPGRDSFIDGWSLGVGPGSVSGDGASVNVPGTPISPNINFGNVKNWASGEWQSFTGWWSDTMPWPLGGGGKPNIPGMEQ